MVLPEGRRAWMMDGSLERVDQVCKEMNAWLVQQSISEPDLFAMQMLAREALNNAVIHGCHENLAVKIHCEIWTNRNGINLKVSDGGPGFNWRSYQAMDMAAINQCSGRGLKIYKLYADQVIFNDAGNQILLNRKPEDNQHAGEYFPG